MYKEIYRSRAPCFTANSADSTDNWSMRCTAATSDALLQSRRGEGLHDRASRLCLHQLHLSENLFLAGLGRRLLAGLDPAEAWECEDAVLLDFFGGDGSKARDHLACNGGLELALF